MSLEACSRWSVMLRVSDLSPHWVGLVVVVPDHPRFVGLLFKVPSCLKLGKDRVSATKGSSMYRVSQFDAVLVHT